MRALEQEGIGFNADAWHRRVGKDLPDVLADHTHVSRSDVLALGTRWRQTGTEEAARELLVGSCIWGFGPTGYGAYRTGLMLATPDAGKRLTATLDLLEEDLPSAYQSMWQANHLDRLGPAFWTKLFYFARYQLRSPEVQPLILDANVARALRARTDEGWMLSSWSSQQYLHYCQLVRDWADAQSAEPHDIEFELFHQGSKRRREARGRRRASS